MCKPIKTNENLLKKIIFFSKAPNITLKIELIINKQNITLKIAKNKEKQVEYKIK